VSRALSLSLVAETSSQSEGRVQGEYSIYTPVILTHLFTLYIREQKYHADRITQLT
jgi:hypothetical protein